LGRYGPLLSVDGCL